MLSKTSTLCPRVSSLLISNCSWKLIFPRYVCNHFIFMIIILNILFQAGKIASCPHPWATSSALNAHTTVLFAKLVKGFTAASSDKAQLGLSHAYSRSKVKFNVHKSDNIQSIALLDQLDKDINTFSMS